MIKIALVLAVLVIGWLLSQMGLKAFERAMVKATRPLSSVHTDIILRRLGQAAGVKLKALRVFDHPMVNAAALSDGTVLISAPLERHFRAGRVSPEELAAVVAHEVGHVAMGHHAQRVALMPFQLLARNAVVVAIFRLIPFGAAILAPLIVGFLITRLTRAQEFEADAYATALMVRAGYGVKPLTSLLGKMIQLQPPSVDRDRLKAAEQSFWATHPPSEARIAAIRAKAGSWGA
ncbi:MAG: M48 family metallopeptidase [Pseudomonadota bacterium]